MYVTHKITGPSPHNQSGVVLIISLVILLLLTLLGLTGMQTTSLEEKMANNMRDKNIAFQAAEAALKIGESKAKDLYAKKTTEGPLGRCVSDKAEAGLYTTEPNIEAPGFWFGENVIILPSKPEDKYLSKYIIQCLPDDGLYRITAYARGVTDVQDAVVILQSVYNLSPRSL